MSNKTQLQANNLMLNTFVRRINAAKDVAASLPEAGSGGSVDPISGMRIVTIPSSTNVYSIEPNVYYKFNSPTASNIKLTLMPGPSGQINEYVIEMPVENADTVITFSPTSTRLWWNESRNMYNVLVNSVTLEAGYTHYLSIIGQHGLAGATVKPKLADTVVSFNNSTNKLTWTKVPDAEWYEVYATDAETANTFPTYSATFTEVPADGITIPGFTSGEMMAEGYIKACSQYYRSSEVRWAV